MIGHLLLYVNHLILKKEMSLVCSSEIPECSDSGMKNFA